MQRSRESSPFSKQRRLALWVVSNCDYTKGAVERMKYMKSLKANGLRVDFGGKCFPNGVKQWKYEDYKFYFAFENSIHCKDYITEKFFHNALDKGAVPVVFGAYKEDYERVAPPNSFIYAQDYTIKDLIDLLNYLDSNDRAYKKYFEWRHEPLLSLYEHQSLDYCQLCRVLHGINYDYIFNRNYFEKYRELKLFTNEPQTRTIPSITHWLYDDEHEDCKLYVFTLTTQIFYQVWKYHSVVTVLLTLALLIFLTKANLCFGWICCPKLIRFLIASCRHNISNKKIGKWI